MLFKSIINFKDLHLSTFWIVVGLLIGIILLEFSTPPDYVFGYLYIGPILLSNSRLSRKTTLQVTLLACLLTLLNLWLPGRENASLATSVSRIIATLALIVTGILSDRNRLYQQALLQQQAKLQSAEKLADVREDFAAMLAHDLKTPLLGAIETLKVLQSANFGSIQSVQPEILTTMIRSHQTTLQIVETLLNVYRNDIEGLKLVYEPVDLVEIAEKVVTTLSDLTSSRRVHISFNYGESNFRQFLWVNGDTIQLQRVFANLFTNAINHSPRGSRVEVSLESSSAYQTVKILDAGAGIIPEELPYLFERFYQGRSDRQASGTGLGLYLSRQIIEAHGGTIWAENLYPLGAMFAFRLPALSRHLAA